MDSTRLATRLDCELKNWDSALRRSRSGELTGRNASPLDQYRPAAQTLLCELEAAVESEGRDTFTDKTLDRLARRFYRLERRGAGLEV